MKTIPLSRSVKAGLVLIAVLLLAFEGFAQDPNFLIFLAFGQSNMEGNARPEQQDLTGVVSVSRCYRQWIGPTEAGPKEFGLPLFRQHAETVPD